MRLKHSSIPAHTDLSLHVNNLITSSKQAPNKTKAPGFNKLTAFRESPVVRLALNEFHTWAAHGSDIYRPTQYAIP